MISLVDICEVTHGGWHFLHAAEGHCVVDQLLMVGAEDNPSLVDIESDNSEY